MRAIYTFKFNVMHKYTKFGIQYLLRRMNPLCSHQNVLVFHDAAY